MPSAPRTSRRWAQFGLRSLLVITTLVAIVLGYHANWLHQRQALLATEGVYDLTEGYAAPRPRAPALLWICGELGVNTLAVMSYVEIDTAEAERLFPEAKVARPSFLSGGIMGFTITQRDD